MVLKGSDAALHWGLEVKGLVLTNRKNSVKIKIWEAKVNTKEGEEKNCRVMIEMDMRNYLSLDCKT